MSPGDVVSRTDVIYFHVAEVIKNTKVVVEKVGAGHSCSSCLVSLSLENRSAPESVK